MTSQNFQDRNFRNSIVLLSGGLDSATCLALALSESETVIALSFDYGQRQRVELKAAETIAKLAGVTRRVVNIDLAQFGGSALTDSSIAVPKSDQGFDDSDSSGSSSAESDQPTKSVTYVPARNTIFLSYALALAEVSQAEAIYIGINALDYSGYPDCRPEFVARFQELANVATWSAIEGNSPRIVTPLLDLGKAEIIKLGMSLDVDYSQTISCYDPDAEGRACRQCVSCRLRQKGFKQARLSDPTRYQD